MQTGTAADIIVPVLFGIVNVAIVSFAVMFQRRETRRERDDASPGYANEKR